MCKMIRTRVTVTANNQTKESKIGARILYTIQVFENGNSIVHQHQRSLDEMKDVVVSPERDFVPASVRLNVKSREGGRIGMHVPPDPNHMKGSSMRITGHRP